MANGTVDVYNQTETAALIAASAAGLLPLPETGVATNLLVNPNFATSANGVGTGWTAEPLAAGTITYTVTTLGGVDGGNAQRIQYTGIAGDTGSSKAEMFQGVYTGFAVGDTMTFQMYMSGSISGTDAFAIIGLECFDINSGFLGNQVLGCAITATPQPFQVPYVNLPSGTAAMAVFFMGYQLGSDAHVDIRATEAVLVNGLLPASQLQDAFPGTILNASSWSVAEGAGAAVSNALQLFTDSAGDFTQVKSVNLYKLTNSNFSAQLVSVGNPTGTSFNSLYAYLDTNNWLAWTITNTGTIQARSKVAGTTTTLGSATYVAAQFAWLRIREQSGEVFFDYSADGSAWTVFTGISDPIAVTSLSMMLEVGGGTSVSTTTWDNVGLFTPAPISGQVPTATGSGNETRWATPSGGGAVASVFGRTGTVTATSGDYTAAQVGADATGAAAAAQAASQPLDSDLTAIAALSTTTYGRSLLTAANAAGAQTLLSLGTLATQSGTFSGTSSGTNTGDQTLPVGGTPAVVLGTAAAAGVSPNFLRRDDTIVAFDATVPSTQAFGDAAAAGSAAVSSRRDHKHAMPATPKDTTAQTGLLKGNGTAITAVTAPAGAVVGTTDTQALTNKDLTGAGNTFPTFNQATTGLAGTATKLATARNINGVAFDGTAAITLNDTTAADFLPIGVAAAGAVGKLADSGHVHPYSPAEPLTSGECIYQRASASGTVTLATGSMVLSYWVAGSSSAGATSVVTQTLGTAASGLTYAAVGIYSVDVSGNLTLIGTTGDLHTTLWASSFTAYTSTLTTHPARVAGTRYALGVLGVGSGLPQLAGSIFSTWNIVAPILTGVVTGQSTLPATVAVGSIGTAFQGPQASLAP